MKKNVRSSNIELLRILMILSIIGHHFVVNSGVVELYDFNNITANMIFLQIFGMWGKTAINVFTLITGYFMVNKDLTVKKILHLYLEMKFYYVLFFVIFLITGYEPFSFKALIKEVLFSTVYEAGILYGGTVLVMYLFVPFINILAKNMSKQQYQLLLLFLLVYFSVFSTFMRHDTFDFLFWMVTCYLLGGYIRLYPGKWDKFKIGGAVTIISVAFMIASIIVVDYIGAKFGFTNYYYMMQDCHKFLAVAASIGIFITFKNLKIPYNKWINTAAATTFGVLMIHANSNSMRKFLWIDLFDTAGHYHSSALWLYASAVVIVVYVVCVALDCLRITFIEKPFFEWLDQYLK